MQQKQAFKNKALIRGKEISGHKHERFEMKWRIAEPERERERGSLSGGRTFRCEADLTRTGRLQRRVLQ